MANQIKVVITGDNQASAALTQAQAQVQAVTANTSEAKAAMALLGEETGIKMPRHLRSLLASIGPLGTAFQLALYPAAGFMLLDVLEKVPEAIQHATDYMAGFSNEAKQAYEDVVKLNAELLSRAPTTSIQQQMLSQTNDEIANLEKQRAVLAGLTEKPATNPEDVIILGFNLRELHNVDAELQKLYGIRIQQIQRIKSLEDDAAKANEKNAADRAKASAAAAAAEAQYQAALDKVISSADEFSAKSPLEKQALDLQKMIDSTREFMAEHPEVIYATLAAQTQEWESQLKSVNFQIQQQNDLLKLGIIAGTKPDTSALKDAMAGVGAKPQLAATPIDPAQYAAIQSLNQQMALTKLATESVSKSFGDLFTGIAQGTRSAADAFRGFADSLIAGMGRMIAKMMEMWLWQQITGLIMGAAVGKIGGSLPLSSFGGFSNLNLAGGVTLAGHAAGGAMAAGEIGLVGEQGPELWVPDTPGRVVPNSQLGRMGAQRSVIVNIDARGATPGERERLETMFRQNRVLSAFDAVSTVAEINRRR